jgi:hypothetical protein
MMRGLPPAPSSTFHDSFFICEIQKQESAARKASGWQPQQVQDNGLAGGKPLERRA